MIEVESATVSFQVSLEKSLLKSFFTKNNARVVCSLNDINLKIEEGCRLGIIGQNGAGKSTMLRMLAGIIQPTEGCTKIQGSVSCLTQIGLYSDPDMTGRELITLEAISKGIHVKKESNLIDDVVSWVDLGEKIDYPLCTYSSGMQLRVSLGAATIVNSDILLMDEWLSVGDAHFAVKAEKRLMEFSKKTQVFVIASHSFEVIRQLCNRVIVLHLGRIVFDGGVEDSISFYEELNES